MRDVQEAHMMDVCVIYRVTGKTKDRRGQYVNTFDDGETSICGVQMEPLATYDGTSYRQTDIDAVLRLPLGTDVKPDDEIEITQRFGEDVPVRRYQVQRYTNDGPSGCRAYLKVRNII